MRCAQNIGSGASSTASQSIERRGGAAVNQDRKTRPVVAELAVGAVDVSEFALRARSCDS